tara:strand:- start:155 stop:469 length:315 start_codon:yes stop_codon:yes gene_type:complete
MKVHAWKVDARYTDRCKYYIQLNDIPGKRVFNRLVKEMKEEWNIFGDGFDKHKEKFVMLATREFDSKQEWVKWARKFPYDVVEYTRDGKPKPIKLGTNYRRKAN